jgi:imidazole glycerol phosphate synthase glutamine amidotransferase subunit
VAVELTFLDYGVGNLHSLRKACEAEGARVTVAERPQDALAARALVLPGVGAFGKVAETVAPIRAELKRRLEEGLPALCVCIGMQLLFESSEEAPGEGIGLLPGAVRRLRHARLPHIGWNGVQHAGRGLFDGLPDGASFYFVHTFAPSSCGDGVVATTDYGGPFAAAVEFKNVWGTQFHPEKSSDAGRRLIGNFVRFAGTHS